MRVAVLAAGEVPEAGLARAVELVAEVDLVIAADGGAAHAAALGRAVDVIVGDLDSAPDELIAAARNAGAEIVDAPAAKDETDLELALGLALYRGADHLVVVGALGGRIDHELANIGVVFSPTFAAASPVIDDGLRRIQAVDDTIELREPAGTTISVLPWAGDAIGVTERGMRWDLDDATLPAGTPVGMSNVAVDPVQRISVRQGRLLVIVDRSAPPG